jgi:hypothetical protein
MAIWPGINRHYAKKTDMEKKQWNRRELLRSLGLAAAAGPLTAGMAADQSATKEIAPVFFAGDRKPGEPVRAIVIGAGSRGWGAYSS